MFALPDGEMIALSTPPSLSLADATGFVLEALTDLAEARGSTESTITKSILACRPEVRLTLSLSPPRSNQFESVW